MCDYLFRGYLAHSCKARYLEVIYSFAEGKQNTLKKLKPGIHPNRLIMLFAASIPVENAACRL
jgi:hypothetical protein